jgi:hypothetical protein
VPEPRSWIAAGALAALCACVGGSGVGCSAAKGRGGVSGAKPVRAAPPALAPEQAFRLYERAQQSSADAVADAMAAADRGEFGMILTGNRSARAIGLACFTPAGLPPHILAALPHGDVIDESVSRWTAYARAYNRTLVDHPAYPDSDLCRAATRDEQRSGFKAGPDRDARPVSAPVRTLHQAARRGDRRDLARLLRSAEVDSADSLGMTPLAWAVARGNRAAIDALLAADADPWAGNPGERTGAVYWAVALGRLADFQRLARLPGRPFTQWPALLQAAAVSSGEVAIVKHMLAEPHDPFRLELVHANPLPAAQMFEPVLSANRALADRLLARSVDHERRADLVRLALEHGADPNAVAAYDTPLGLVANGLGEQSVEIVDLLLRAGADPNRVSHRTHPVWTAATALRIGRERGEWTDRARTIFLRLVAAGARLDLPDDQGRPPISFLLFPARWGHWELDRSIPPELIELLVSHGLDVNATWEGKRMLSAVERQAGRESPLAVTLRRLGARH